MRVITIDVGFWGGVLVMLVLIGFDIFLWLLVCSKRFRHRVQRAIWGAFNMSQEQQETSDASFLALALVAAMFLSFFTMCGLFSVFCELTGDCSG